MIVNTILWISICTFNCTSVLAQNTSYYIQDEQGNVQEQTGDVNEVQAAEWHVRLYREGERTGGRNYHGLLIGESAEDVMAQLKEGQEFQRSFAKWTGRDYRLDPSTYFNPLGPIAVIRAPRPEVSRVLEGLIAAAKKIREFRRLYKQADRLLSNNPKSAATNPQIGRVLREYIDNLKDAESRVVALQSQIRTDSLIGTIEHGMSVITDSLNKAESHRAALKAFLSNTTDSSADWKSFSSQEQSGDEQIETTSKVLIENTSLIVETEVKCRDTQTGDLCRNFNSVSKISLPISSINPDSLAISQVPSEQAYHVLVKLKEGSPEGTSTTTRRQVNLLSGEEMGYLSNSDPATQAYITVSDDVAANKAVEDIKSLISTNISPSNIIESSSETLARPQETAVNISSGGSITESKAPGTTHSPSTISRVLSPSTTLNSIQPITTVGITPNASPQPEARVAGGGSMGQRPDNKTDVIVPRPYIPQVPTTQNDMRPRRVTRETTSEAKQTAPLLNEGQQISEPPLPKPRLDETPAAAKQPQATNQQGEAGALARDVSGTPEAAKSESISPAKVFSFPSSTDTRPVKRLNPEALRYAEEAHGAYESENWARAEDAYRKAIRLEPDVAEWHHFLGSSLLMRAKYKEAKAEIVTAIRLHPNDAMSHVLLGWSHYYTGNKQDAEGAFREAIRLEPDNAVTHFNFGRFLYWEKKWPEAVESFRRAVQLDPSAEYQDNLDRAVKRAK